MNNYIYLMRYIFTFVKNIGTRFMPIYQHESINKHYYEAYKF
jgi:hypothetical protein